MRWIPKFVLLALGASTLMVGPAGAASSPTIDTSVYTSGSGTLSSTCEGIQVPSGCYFTYMFEGSTTGPEPSGLSLANFTLDIELDPGGSNDSWCQIDLGYGTANWVEGGTEGQTVATPTDTCIATYTNALLGQGTLTVHIPITNATGEYAPLLHGTLSFSGNFFLMTTPANPLHPLSEVSLDLFNAGLASLNGTLSSAPPAT
jgi:hypothetical protein